LARPRSTWLRKLSLTPARSAIVLSVARRRRRMSRRRSPTSTSARTSGALEGIQLSLDAVEGKLKRPYGACEAVSTGAKKRGRPSTSTERKGQSGHAIAHSAESPDAPVTHSSQRSRTPCAKGQTLVFGARLEGPAVGLPGL